MLRKSKWSYLFLSLSAMALFLGSVEASAQYYSSSYENGYDDGYDDAMYDCPCPPKLRLLSGFYAGVEGGYENHTLSYRGMETGIFDFRYNQSAPGWVGNIYGGYNWICPHKFQLGGEIFVGSSAASGNSSVSFTTWSANAQVLPGTSFGFTFKPGYLISPSTKVYADLGYIRTEFTDKQSVSGAINRSASTTNWANGFSYGLGMETRVYKQLAARLEFKHIDYSSYNDSKLGAKVSPSDNQGMLGLSYYFKF